MANGAAPRAIAISALMMALTGCGGEAPRRSTIATVSPTVGGSASVTTSQSSSTRPVMPDYSITATTTNRRFDNKTTYYVVIPGVNLGDDSFKASVKSVVQALSFKNGSPTFSANIYDDAALARTAVSQDVDLTEVSASETQVRSAEEVQHLIAMYDGGIDENAQHSTAAAAYAISRFPAADASSPNVGPYVDLSEQFKP